MSKGFFSTADGKQVFRVEAAGHLEPLCPQLQLTFGVCPLSPSKTMAVHGRRTW